jgi:one cut domain, family member 1 (hepatocyte nuclear factor 6)
MEKIAGGGGGGGPVACKRKEDPRSPDHVAQPKKPRLVFTDLQRRTLQAIFKVRDSNGNFENFEN